MARGLHLLIDARDIPYQVANEDFTRRLFTELVHRLRLTPASDIRIVHFPADEARGVVAGLSAFILLKESHISYHSFGEERGFAFDIYSCKPFDTAEVDHIVRKAFLNKGVFWSRVFSRDLSGD